MVQPHDRSDTAGDIHGLRLRLRTFMTSREGPGRVAAKRKKTAGRKLVERAGYHHGDLRSQLIIATRKLLSVDGPESVKLAEACRLAGVSSAAPYRHFADRDAMLMAVAVDGFVDLRNQLQSAASEHPVGSVAAVTAIGQGYVRFAMNEPHLFRLMFGHSEAMPGSQGPVLHKKGKTSSDETESYPPELLEVTTAGRQTYEVLLVQLAASLARTDIDHDVVNTAFPLWAFVHGLAFLVIDDKLDVNEMPIDINEQISTVTLKLMPSRKIDSR